MRFLFCFVFLLFVFVLFLDCVPLRFSSFGFLFSLVLCRALLTSVIILSLQCFFLVCIYIFYIYIYNIFYQCPEVTLCGWWYIKSKKSLNRSNHLFLVIFFLHIIGLLSVLGTSPPPLFFSPFFSFFLPTYCQWFSSFQLHKFSP